jgi:hypothetical protein
MSREWSSQSTSKLPHRTPKLLPSLSPLNTQATPEERSGIDDVGVNGANHRNVPDANMTSSHLSSTHVTADPDLYYPPSFPPLFLPMYTGRQATDSDSQSRDLPAQYATLRLPLPHGPSASVLPSPDFPSSVGSFPPTATTTEFPLSTAGLGLPSYDYGAYVHSDSDLSLASASKFGLHPPVHKISSEKQSGRIESTLLSGDSRMDVNSGSKLDPVRVAGPPSGGGVVPLRIRRQQQALLRAPQEPVYEGSEVQSSSISLTRVQTSRPFNMTGSFHDVNDNKAAFIGSQKESKSSEERLLRLLPPTVELPDNTSPLRQSFQTHATAGSTAHGHDGPSLPPTPTLRTSAMPLPDQRRWAEVIQSIKTSNSKAQATDSNTDRLSVEALLGTRGDSSSNASQSNSSNSQGPANSSLVPPPVPGGSTSDGLLTSASVTSGVDSFNSFELMSFPKPPTAVPEKQGSTTPTTRSPWVKGLTLPMPTNMATSRRSMREPGTPTALSLRSTSVPRVPALSLSSSSPSTPLTPLSAPGLNPTFHVAQAPSQVVVTTHSTPVPTVAIPEGSQSPWTDSGPPSPASRETGPPLQSKSQLSLSSVNGSMTANSKYCPLNQSRCITHVPTGVTPSYNRRISALIHATEQLMYPSRDLAGETDPQPQMSMGSDQLVPLDRQSEDEPTAVVGVVRIASFSCRSKALLTRAPSSGALATSPATRVQHAATGSLVAPLRLNTEDSVLRNGVHASLSKAPSPSFTATTASPSSPTQTSRKLSPSLRRQPPGRELGFFPESVGEVDDQFVLAHDVDRTRWGMTPLDVRGVGTRMDRGAKNEARTDGLFYNERDLPRVPYPESRESPVRNRSLPPLPPLPLPPLPSTIPPPANLSDAHVQSHPDHTSGPLQSQESFGSNTLTRVSSLLSKLSNSTLHSIPTNPSRQSTRRSKRGTIIPPPLPPPPLPLPLTPTQMRLPGLRPQRDEGPADHELMERAEGSVQDSTFLRQGWDRYLNQKPLPTPSSPLDEPHLYHQQMPQQQAQSSKGRGYIHKNALSKASSIRSMFSNRSDRTRHRIPSSVVLGISAPMGGDGSGRFTELDDEKRKRHAQMHTLGVDPHQPQEAGPDPSVSGRNTGGPRNGKQWSRGSKWLAMILFSLALIGLVVGLAIILARRNADNQASGCTGSNSTGRFCDISTCYFALLYSVGTNSPNRQDLCLHLKCVRPL